MQNFNLPQFQTEALRAIKDAVIGVNAKTEVVYWNKGAEMLFGISAAEALQEKLDALYSYEWLDPEDAKRSAEEMAAYGTWRGETLHTTRAGRKVYVELTVSNVVQDGEVYGMMAILRNITARIEVEQEKEAMMQKLLSEAKKISNLQDLLTVCAWSGQVKRGERWIEMEQFLREEFGVKISHGISPEKAEELRREFFKGRGGGQSEF